MWRANGDLVIESFANGGDGVDVMRRQCYAKVSAEDVMGCTTLDMSRSNVMWQGNPSVCKRADYAAIRDAYNTECLAFEKCTDYARSHNSLYNKTACYAWSYDKPPVQKTHNWYCSINADVARSNWEQCKAGAPRSEVPFDTNMDMCKRFDDVFVADADGNRCYDVEWDGDDGAAIKLASKAKVCQDGDARAKATLALKGASARLLGDCFHRKFDRA